MEKDCSAKKGGEVNNFFSAYTGKCVGRWFFSVTNTRKKPDCHTWQRLCGILPCPWNPMHAPGRSMSVERPPRRFPGRGREMIFFCFFRSRQTRFGRLKPRQARRFGGDQTERRAARVLDVATRRRAVFGAGAAPCLLPPAGANVQTP